MKSFLHRPSETTRRHLGTVAVLVALALVSAAAPARAGSTAGPHAGARVTPPAVARDDAHATVVTLDGTTSTAASPEGSLRYRWTVPGAVFVEGTTATSAVARVTLAGDAHVPVKLEVTDEGTGARASTFAAVDVIGSGVGLGGQPAAWHPLDLRLRGPFATETDVDPNPFLDHRLVVELVGPAGQSYTVPGYFDGDGKGGSQGNVWRARFAPDAGGRWHFRVSLRSGPGVAVDLDPQAGQPAPGDGREGDLLVLDRDPEAEGFLRYGRLDYVGGHYLKHRDGPYFLKGGTDSPENFLAYLGFDDVLDNGNLGILHQYAPHVADFRPGDPEFQSSSTGIDSHGIVGALNYLSSVDVNSIYFLPMNLGGDGQDTCPFVGYANAPFDKTHYDVSRMRQWAEVFDHAQRRGILLHVVLAETEPENETWLDGGDLGVERKLFFREMVARFGHALGLKWNLCEENDFSVGKLVEFATYLQAQDPYDHPIAVHTHSNLFYDYQALAGNELFSATSIQYDPDRAGAIVEEWRQRSKQAGRAWVLDMDENNPYWQGLMDDNEADLRKRVLYDVYFSGGNIEWYAGYHQLPLGGDVTLEDFRTREAMWKTMGHARRLMQKELPFWEMEPADGLLTGETLDAQYGGGEVFAKPNEVYAVYLPNATATGVLDLSGAGGIFRQRWFDPREGRFSPIQVVVQGGGPHALGPPPDTASEDWVAIIGR